MTLVVEVLLWLSSLGAFLMFYILGHGVSGSVILPHIGLVFSYWLLFICIRLVNWKFFSKFWGGAVGLICHKAMAVFFLYVPLLALISYYFFVVVGLLSWGRVTTWSLVATYARQGEMFAEALGLDQWLFFTVLVVFFLPFIFIYKVVDRIDWTSQAAIKISWKALFFISQLALLLVLLQLFRMHSETGLHPQEPVGVSFLRGGLSNLQSHKVKLSVELELAEAHAMKAYRSAKKFNARNVVLIVGDALRADHMSLYGYHRLTTPYLDASSEVHQTLKVSRARSVCAESSCGLIALASSRFMHKFPSRSFTLYEVLRRHGYRVHMALSGDHTNFYGLKDAYGKVDEYFDGSQQSSRYLNDDELLNDYVSSLPNFDGGRPVMFQFHLMSSHGLGKRHKKSEMFSPYTNYQIWPIGMGRRAPSLEEVPRAINYYDNGVVQFDRSLHQILGRLEEKGYLTNAVIVVTGDHGEMLGEKGIFGHRHRVYEEVLNIPIVIQRRGYTGMPLSEWPVGSQVDVAPTILAELGIRPPEIWQGVPLQSTVTSRLVYFQQAQRAGLYDVDEKRIMKYWKAFDSGEEFVYDVENDPEERQSILNSVPEDILPVWRREAASSTLYIP